MSIVALLVIFLSVSLGEATGELDYDKQNYIWRLARSIMEKSINEKEMLEVLMKDAKLLNKLNEEEYDYLEKVVEMLKNRYPKSIFNWLWSGVSKQKERLWNIPKLSATGGSAFVSFFNSNLSNVVFGDSKNKVPWNQVNSKANEIFEKIKSAK